ncbi:MAG: OsmC family protein [Gammaproteobacteria bacterium]
MSEHTALIRWHNSRATMESDSYPRDHHWEFPGGPAVQGSAAESYGGGKGCIDPEEGLVASVAACHMLTFLAIAAKKKMVVASYTDQPVGHLEKDADGRIAITRIELRPVVQFGSGTEVSADDLRRLHDSAHRNCFIANSIKAEVSVAA